MRNRQVHLDFHTSELIENIGVEFSREQFQQALKTGHVNSITVFSKCHHGWAYHPSTANEIHPNLKFDLLGAQIEAAHEIDVKTPVYLSAGLDEKIARRHPDWILKSSADEKELSFDVPMYHRLCFNSPYLDYLLAQIKEVCEHYEADGIFLDIVGVQPCYCSYCRKILSERGLDTENIDNVMALAEETYANYTRCVRETIDSVKPGLPVFHNGGHIARGRRDLAHMNSHLELESLPTGGWGYSHFPVSAAYARILGMDFLGMTGKFHTTWGEFGGFKHPNALRYETALAMVNGAGCSVGDQLHPSGKMDMATYKLIGAGYSEYEEKEKYTENTTLVADIAVLSSEAVHYLLKTYENGRDSAPDNGVVKILSEGKYLFNVVDCVEKLDQYKVVILPDDILLTEELCTKLKTFTAGGGKIIASGISGLNTEKNAFMLDFGTEYDGKNEFSPAYFRPAFDIPEFENTAFVVSSPWHKLKNVSGEILGMRENPYFNRTAEHFCSHLHAPVNAADNGAGMVCGRDGIYISWNVFTEYDQNGALIHKRTVQHALDLLLGDSITLKTDFPAQGIVTLFKGEERLLCHLLYASPVKRGSVEVIEDIIPIYNTKISLKTDGVKSVKLVPQNTELEFSQKDGRVEFTVPKTDNHQMVEIR